MVLASRRIGLEFLVAALLLLAASGLEARPGRRLRRPRGQHLLAKEGRTNETYMAVGTWRRPPFGNESATGPVSLAVETTSAAPETTTTTAETSLTDVFSLSWEDVIPWPIGKVRRLAWATLALTARLSSAEEAKEQAKNDLKNLTKGRRVAEEDVWQLGIIASSNITAEVAREDGFLFSAAEVAELSHGFRGEDLGPNGTLRSFQGDMVPENDEQLTLYRKIANGSEAWVAAGAPWRDGKVKYCFASDTTQRVRRAFQEAARMVTRALPCLSFVDVGWQSGASQDPGELHACQEPQAIFVTSAPQLGCFSYVGMTGRRAQQLQLQDPGCTMVGTVLHELGHVLGMAHEQSRPDRDSYIKVNFDNVQDGMEVNFGIEPKAYMRTSYDYLSIMHYDAYAFAKTPGVPTMERIDGLHDMGQRSGLAASDVDQLAAMYLTETPGCRGPAFDGMGCIDTTDRSGNSTCPKAGWCPLLGSDNCCACGGGLTVQCYVGEDCPRRELVGYVQRKWPMLLLATLGLSLLMTIVYARRKFRVRRSI